MRPANNPGMLRTLAYSEPEACLEPWQTSTMESFANIVNGYNKFPKLKVFSQYQLFTFSNLWNKYHEFSLMQVKLLLLKNNK